MGKSETLRGQGAFDALFASGLRTNALLFRCLYKFECAPPGTVRVGFLVPRNSGSAVRRNRLRRLMREAFRREQDGFLEALHEAGRSVALAFVFRGSSAEGPFHLDTVHRDIQQLCRSVLASAVRVPQ